MVAKWRVLCGLSSETNGKKVVFIRPSANTLFDGMDTGALPFWLPKSLAAFAPAPVLSGNGVCLSDRDGKLSREEVVKVLGAKDGAVLWNLAGKLDPVLILEGVLIVPPLHFRSR